MDRTTAKSSEINQSEKEFELLEAAIEMDFDGQHPSEHYPLQLNEKLIDRKQQLVQLESQWDALVRPLEEKKRSLEMSLSEMDPEAFTKLQRLNEVESETESILSEIKRREDALFKLSSELDDQPRLPSRISYIEKIKEITKNIRKQDADIEQILKETRELQLESNSIQERLHRTYAVVDKTVFREAQKDAMTQKAYSLLSSNHENFEKVYEVILSVDRTRREVAHYEAKLAATGSHSFNIDKIQADLDSLRQENNMLEQQLRNP